jgi:hypothetical protein
MSLDALGEDAVGFDVTAALGPILQSAGGLATGIASTVKQAQEEKKLAADQEAKVKAAVAADLAAANALARAAVSAKDKKPTAAMDQKAADIALASQQEAASKLTPDGNEVRASAAKTAQALAITAAQAAPNDATKAALVDAWTNILNRANNAAIVSKADGGAVAASGGEESFLAKKVIGPVPVWGAGLGAIAAGVLAKKFLF